MMLNAEQATARMQEVLAAQGELHGEEAALFMRHQAAFAAGAHEWRLAAAWFWRASCNQTSHAATLSRSMYQAAAEHAARIEREQMLDDHTVLLAVQTFPGLPAKVVGVWSVAGANAASPGTAEFEARLRACWNACCGV